MVHLLFRLDVPYHFCVGRFEQHRGLRKMERRCIQQLRKSVLRCPAASFEKCQHFPQGFVLCDVRRVEQQAVPFSVSVEQFRCHAQRMECRGD